MTTITEDYISFEVAKLLKEKGFNEECNRVYQGPNLKYTTLPISPLMSLGELGGFHPKQLYVNNNELGDIVYTAPTLQMAMKWLREKHLLHISIDMINGGKWEYEIDDINVPFDGGILPKYYCDKTFSSYEEAADDAIKYCLEHLI